MKNEPDSSGKDQFAGTVLWPTERNLCEAGNFSLNSLAPILKRDVVYIVLPTERLLAQS